MSPTLHLRARAVAGLRRSHLWAQILTALALGVIFGLMLSPEIGGPLALTPAQAEITQSWLHLPGQIFLNMIQMVVITLVSTSIILGISSAGDPDVLARVASRVTPYFVVTTTIAVLIGATIATIIQPGQYLHIDLQAVEAAPQPVASPTDPASVSDAITQGIANIIPANLAEATYTRNMMQIVFASIMVGVAITLIGTANTAPLVRLLQIVQDVSLKIVSWAMRLAPLAVFGLIAEFVLDVGLSSLVALSAYIASVILGLLVLLGVYYAIATFIGRRNPIEFMSKIADAQILAFSTSSSAATMPLTLKIARERLETSPAISQFIVPLGATVNMDGTALYQVVAALFVSQAFGVHLSPPEFIMLVVTVVGASIGSPSTPGVGIVILATILQSLGIPPSGVAILLGVDRLLDMCRTSVNVTGDLVACTVMDHWLKDELPEVQPDVQTQH